MMPKMRGSRPAHGYSSTGWSQCLRYVAPVLVALHINHVHSQSTSTPTPTPTAVPTPAPTQAVGPCNNGGNRGWLEKVTEGYHPIGPFGPSGMHGSTGGISKSNITIEVAELAEVGTFPPGKCCPQHYYPGRLYRISVSCPETCAILLSVEYANADLSLGTASYEGQVGSWPQVTLDADPQMMKFLGANPYNSIASVGQISSSLARSYSAVWYAPSWDKARYSPLEIRATAVLDQDTMCPGIYSSLPMPALVVCGDSLVDVVEACDDGNLVDGDGCDSECYVEVGWTCDGRTTHPETGYTMSVCTAAEVNMFPQTIVIEEGSRGTYNFNLSTYVTGDSYLAINNAFQGELATVGRSVYKIVPEDWSETRTVTIEIRENDDVEGTRNYTMMHDMSSLDPNWMLEPGSVPNVTVIVTDNDRVGVRLDPPVLDLMEFGDFKTYFVSLMSRPKSFVTVTISHTPPNFQMLFSPSVLLFDSGNWNIPQQVIVQVPDNNNIDGQVIVTAMHLVESVADPLYNFNASENTVTITVDDNDAPGVRAVPREVAVTEGTESFNYTVSLTSQPVFGSNVTLLLSTTCESDQPNSCSIAAVGPEGKPNVVFGRNNWDQGVEVRVTGVDNFYADGSRVGTVSHTIVTDDPNYVTLQLNDPQAPWLVDIVVKDDDVPGIAHPDSVTLREGIDTSVDVVLRLLTTPYFPVRVDLAVQDTTLVSLSTDSVSWLPSEWDAERVITISPNTDDLIYRGTLDTMLLMTSSSEDAAYDDILKRGVPVSVIDNDRAGIDLGLGSAASSILVVEGATSRVLEVTLTSKPLHDVALKISTGAQITADPDTLIFTPDTYFSPQPLRITAVDDVNVEDSEHFDAVRILAESRDPGYEIIELQQVVRVRDNDSPDSAEAVDRWGGQICPTDPCGQVAITIPPQAILESEVQISAAITGSKLAPGVAGPVKGSRALRVSGIFSFEPHATKFRRPVYITVEYDQLAAGLSGYELAFFRKNDPLSAGWQREEGGNFSNGIAMLQTDHLSLYFVGIMQINETSIYDQEEEEQLECPVNEIEASALVAFLIVVMLFSIETCGLLGFGTWLWLQTHKRVAPAKNPIFSGKPGNGNDVLMIEAPEAEADKDALLALEPAKTNVKEDFTGEPPLPEDRPTMVGTGFVTSRHLEPHIVITSSSNQGRRHSQDSTKFSDDDPEGDFNASRVSVVKFAVNDDASNKSTDGLVDEQEHDGQNEASKQSTTYASGVAGDEVASIPTEIQLQLSAVRSDAVLHEDS